MLNLEEQINKQINKADNILLVFNANWNGDALSSSLALFLALQKMGKKVEIASFLDSKDKERQKKANLFKFLPAYKEIQTSLKNLRKFIVSVDISHATINQIKYTVDGQKLNFIISPESGWFKPEDISSSSSGFKYDLVIVVDSPDLESLGGIYDRHVEFFYKTNLINIDHRASNEEYGQINYLDLKAVSSAEIIFKLLQTLNIKIDEDIATCLLSGIISRTKNFKTANLTPRTLLASSKLISAGARREEIINQLYRSRPLSILKIWGKILNALQAEKNNRLLWVKLEKNEADELINSGADLNEIAEEIIAGIPEAELLLIAWPQEEKLQLFAYAIKGLSAHDILQEWQGKGDKNSAFGYLDGVPENWKESILDPIRIKLDKLAKNNS